MTKPDRFPFLLACALGTFPGSKASTWLLSNFRCTLVFSVHMGVYTKTTHIML